MTDLQKELECSILELTQRYLVGASSIPQGLLEALEVDPRVAARTLAKKLRAVRRANRVEGQRLRNLLRYESDLWAKGLSKIAGVDEAGMAPLAGPVVAAAVILPPRYKLRGLDDSKKILDPDRREKLAIEIKRDAVCFAVGVAQVEEIDRLNIYHAGLLAMERAVIELCPVPEFTLVDARRIPNCPAPQRGIIHGDALSMSIAAASILAKTTRDALMTSYDAQYPGYGLAAHKGYPTPFHCERLRTLGPTPIHRRSFNRVREALGLGG